MKKNQKSNQDSKIHLLGLFKRREMSSRHFLYSYDEFLLSSFKQVPVPIAASLPNQICSIISQGISNKRAE